MGDKTANPSEDPFLMLVERSLHLPNYSSPPSIRGALV